jgi:predicted nucleic acid-binding protein
MRRYLLDSSLLAGYLNGRPIAVQLITPWTAARQAATSVLCYAEVLEYIKGFPNFAVRHTQLKQLLSEVYPYFLTYPILDRYTEIRRQLRRSPTGSALIGDVDTLIAATALERNLTVVTTDADFQRVPQLLVHFVPRDQFRTRAQK